jgi:V/A-type H+/Na+-transporting ATPase subunit I
MFKPREMKRILIIGAKEDLERTIELLHSQELAHIIDYKTNDAESYIQLGSPLQNASEASQKLIKLRSSAQLLNIDKEAPEIPQKISDDHIKRDINLKIQDLELSVLSLSEDKNRIEEHFRTIDERIRSLEPFAALDILLENYRDYDHIMVYTGYVTDSKKLNDDLMKITDEFELFTSSDADQMVGLFINKVFAEQTEKKLSEHGFIEVKLPEGKGLPKMFIEKWKDQQKELSEKLVSRTKDLLEFRKRYAEFILASEEYLSIEVQKAEAPVRFGTTSHSFIIDCWIPVHSLNQVKETLKTETDGSLYVQDFEMEHDDEPPTLLENPKPVRRFEYLLEMYSIPNYHDIDPSIILSLIFPLFFGLMIGDVGYGILLIVFGVVFMKKFKDSEGLSNIGWYIIIAGIFSLIFGLFVFGDMFGLTFQNPAGEKLIQSWSDLLHVQIPIPSLIHKMETIGFTKLLIISIFAGFLHLGLGLILGVVTERKHNKKHAISKVGLICVLTALVFMICVFADWTTGQLLKPLKETVLGPFLWSYIIPSVKAGVHFGALLIPYSTIILAVLGVVLILVTTKGIGLIEVLEITSHLISYTRLAAICVAKAAMAFAFNLIGLSLILSGNIIVGILGIILTIVMQLFVLALGSLSSGIQAVRLHYVEFFMKFYKGEGVKFTPFKYTRKYTVAK